MSRSILRRIASLLLPAIGFAGGGCGATVYSPPHPVDPTTIYVADYGRHSSVFFPMGREAYVEYSYGDWNFYALSHTSTWDGLDALFCSSGATLARRYARSEPGLADPPHRFDPRIFPLRVACADMERTRDKLESRWRSLSSTKVFTAADDAEFVRDPGRYSFLFTCNDWTARILREMKCKIVGITTTSNFHSGDKPPPEASSRSTIGSSG